MSRSPQLASSARDRIDALEAELAAARAHQAATAEILRIIGQSPASVQRVLDTIAQRVALLCDAQDVEVFRLDVDTFRLEAGHGPLFEETHRAGLATAWKVGTPAWTALMRNSIPGRALTTQRTVVEADLAVIPETELFAGIARRLGVRSFVAAPMLRYGDALGVIFMRRRVVRPFTQAEIQLVETFATQAVIAIENARLFQQSEEASRHKSTFMASMSHELRTPLNAIIGFSQLLLEPADEPEDEETRRTYLDLIFRSGSHLLDLVNDVLDLSKVEAGRMELYLERVDLAALVADALQRVGPLAAQKGIVLSAVTDGAGVIQADRMRLRQVLLNLLSNAIKFTTPGGTVLVTAERGSTELRVSVVDSGIGIAPEDLVNIFEEFRQAEHVSPGQGEVASQGTGLGLPLAKRMVALHGGQLWVESGVGKGSTFAFTLPLNREGEHT